MQIMSQREDTKRASESKSEPKAKGGSQRDAGTLAVKPEQPAPNPEPMAVPDDKALERMGKVNQRLIKDHSDRLILAVVEGGETKLWWVRPVKLELLNDEERDWFDKV
jgi:hypothetical protein